MDLSLASIIAVAFVVVVVVILRRQVVLRQRMGALRGEMAVVQRERVALEIAVTERESTPSRADDGERR
jgi:hypothetical protein